MFLSDIIIYPVKSLPGIHITKSKVERRGLQHDRRWMLIDENNQFITIRKYHKLLLFDLHLTDEGFVIKHRESGDTMEMPWTIAEGNEVMVSIWNDEVEAIEGKDEWSSWLGEKLDISCRLVYMDERTNRPIKKEWSQHNEIVSFADAFPLLVVGSASLANLNEQLEHHITIDRFRPSLVFEGGESYEEFRWSKFKIGDNLFQGLKPCERCVVPNLDPVTAVKGREPLHTLSRQKIDGKIVFGQHAFPIDTKTIRISDSIEVVNYKDSPYDPF